MNYDRQIDRKTDKDRQTDRNQQNEQGRRRTCIMTDFKLDK